MDFIEIVLTIIVVILIVCYLKMWKDKSNNSNEYNPDPHGYLMSSYTRLSDGYNELYISLKEYKKLLNDYLDIEMVDVGAKQMIVKKNRRKNND